jgi:nucleotide-binding universal stress UspA family protein
MLIKENHSILIPVDFSKQSLVAVKQSYNLAKFTNSKIVLMHVSPKSDSEHKEDLAKLAQQTRTESGMQVETINLKGDVYELTDKKAEELASSLIIIGLDTQVKFRSFLGSNTASKFIKNAPCPVVTIRSLENKSTCKNIVLPFDTTPESREKVPIVVQLAKYYNADIRIISVFSPNDHKYENELLPYLQQIKKFIKEKGVNCSNKSIPSNNMVEAIIDYANKNECDLIVQMNKKDLSIGELFVGNVSQKLVDLSNIPVLSINPMKRESLSSGIH